MWMRRGCQILAQFCHENIPARPAWSPEASNGSAGPPLLELPLQTPPMDLPASPLGLEMDGMAAPLFNVQDAVVAPLPEGGVSYTVSSLPLDDAPLDDDDVDENVDLS